MSKLQDDQVDAGPSSVSPASSKATGQLNLDSLKRNSSTPMKSPCFVHSYLDSGLGNFRSYFDSQQGASIPEHSPDEAVDAGKSGAAFKAQSSQPNVATGTDVASTDVKVRKASTRPQPMHRGMRGAVEPDSDDNPSSNEDDDSTTSSLEDEYRSSEEEAQESRVRSLTRQLAETAVGVREMSKQLGRARVKSTIQSVLIITKARDNHLIKLTRELAIWLMNTPRNGKDVGLTVYVDSQLRQSKRFDAEGIRNEYPHLFSPSSTRTHSGNGSADVANSTGSLSEHPKSAQSSASLASSRAGSISQLRDESLLRYWTSDMCSRSPHLFDFVVTLGGDGTVLFCSWLFQRIVPPVMPFALGSLGFLTNFDFKHYKKVVQSALETGIRVNLRMRFTATVYRATFPSDSKMDKKKRRAIKSGKTGEIIMKNVQEVGWESIETPLPQNGDLRGDDDEDDLLSDGDRSARKPRKDKEIMCFSTRPVETFEVLNDLVVDRGPSPYVSLLEVFGDEHHLTTAQADGLCISTPTGSTAYSLSAGGSLVHPEIPAILISPICPHTLSFRPMLLPDSMELRIAVPYNSRSTAWASFDGRGRVELKQGDHIKVTASKYPFPTVCADNQSKDWFESISRTLKWNERQRQKSFVVVEEGDEESVSDRPTQNGSTRSGPEKQGVKHAQNSKQRAGNVADVVDQGSKGYAAERKGKGIEIDDEDDDDEEEDEEDEQEEHFDIEDTSQAATRVNSPAPGTPNLSRRHSTTNDGRRHHHHHQHGHGHRTRSSNGSYPSSAGGSSSALPIFGLTPMTSTSERSVSNGGTEKVGLATSAPSSATKVSFDSNIPSDRASNSGKYQHGVVQPSPRSLLDSPDRFGQAGPPAPPRALSERHLATADFRLDDDPDPESDLDQPVINEKTRDGIDETSQDGKPKPTSTRQTTQDRNLRDSVLHAAESKTKIASNTNKLYKKVKGRAASTTRSMKARSNADDVDGFNGGFDLGRTDSRKSGGAALVVYGQDESDSDSTAEG